MGDINPEVQKKVEELEKQHPGLKVNKLKTLHGKLDIEVG
jgi:hypothetical protein